MNADKRLVCTPESPYDRKSDARWLHPDAVDDGECFEGCCDYYKCPNCGLRWREEQAQ